jgi:rhamnose transport system permease protein
VAGLAGVLFAARLGSVRGNLAEGFELDIITMVLLGGVSIFGGSGTLVGVALSILIILNLRSGLGLANIQATTQTGIIGALLIASVLVPSLVDRLGRWRRRSGPTVMPPPSSSDTGPGEVRPVVTDPNRTAHRG